MAMTKNQNPNALKGEPNSTTYSPLMSVGILQVMSPTAAIVLGLIAGRIATRVKSGKGTGHSIIYRGQPLEKISERYMVKLLGCAEQTITNTIKKLTDEGFLIDYGGRKGGGTLNRAAFGGPHYDRQHIYALTEKALSYYPDLAAQIAAWQKAHPEAMQEPQEAPEEQTPAPVIQDVSIDRAQPKITGFELPF